MDHLLTDLKLALTIGLNNNVGCCLVFRTTFLHQICDKWNSLIVLDQRTVMVIFDAVKDCLRFCCEENNKTVSFIADLMEKRRAKYEAAADIIIETDGKNELEICEELVHRLRTMDEEK